MSNPASPRRSHRLWFLLAVLGLVAVALLVIALQPELERNFRSWAHSSVFLAAAALVLIWFVLLSGFRWRTRVIGVALLAGAWFAGKALLRVDGTTDGRGLPKLAWKWTPKRELQFPPAPASPSPLAEPAATPAGLQDSPQFLGPNRDGVIHGVNLARDWETHPPKLVWRQPIGLGWSSFAVVGGRAYTQEQRGEEELVTCYNAFTGALLWSHANRVRFSEWQGGDGPRATPTVTIGRVFAIGATGILDCLDSADGRRIWSRDVLEENNLKSLTWGATSSPLVIGDCVVVNGGAGAGPTLLAYHRATGEPLWRAGTDKASHASPVAATVLGRQVILSANAATLTIHDPATGELLLDHRWSEDRYPKASQPVLVPGDRVFLSAGYGQGCVMLQISAASGGKLSAAQLWKNVRMKTQFNSAAYRDGFLYGLDDGLLACVDVEDGDRRWKGGRYGSGQSLVADDLVLVQSERGPVILAAAHPDDFEELGRIPALSSKTWNQPALAGRYLFVRNDQEAACYELPVTGAPPAQLSSR